MSNRSSTRINLPETGRTQAVGNGVFLIDSRSRAIIWSCDADGRIEENVGESCHRHIHGLSRPCGALDGSCPLEEVIRTGSPATFTREVENSLNEYREVRVTILPIPSQVPDLSLVVEIIDEPDTENIRKDRLVKLQRMATATTLSNMAVHDFNNMLTAIIGRADMLLGKMDEKHAFWRMMSGIQRTGEKAADLTRQLLRFTRQPPAAPTEVRLNEILDSMRETFPVLLGSEYEFRFELDKGIRPFTADVTDIEQMVINLVLNACDAMPDGGTITISTESLDDSGRCSKDETSDRYTCLNIRDEGAGITACVKEILFQPFGSSRENSLGLGLFAVRTMVEKWGGFISVEPGLDGKGSVASVRFPVESSIGTERDNPETAESDKLIPRGSETLLLIEDVEEVRDLAELILSDLGYSVLAASDGMQAIQLFESASGGVDIVLSDVVLPGMRGTEVYKVIKRRNPNQKVIFMSGYINDQVLQSELGGNDVPFLPKPFTTEELARIVRDTIDSKNA